MSGPGAVHLEELARRTGDGALAMGLDGRILLWNDAATALLGHGRAEVLDRPCWEVLAGRDERGPVLCARDCAVMRGARAGAVVGPFDMLSRTKSGAALALSVSTLSGRADDPGRLIVLHLLRDASKAPAGPTPVTRSHDDAPLRLTPRELEVLALTRDGDSMRGIALRLGLSHATVRNHTQSILRKLGAHTRLEAVAIARRGRLLP